MTTATLRIPSLRPRRTHPLEQLAARAGVDLDGSGPCSVKIRDRRVFTAAEARGLTGLRDAYVAGWWDAERLDVVSARLLSLREELPWDRRARMIARRLAARVSDRQSLRRSRVGVRHYDLGNDLFEAMLDRRMNYSCGYWRAARDLEESQEAKLDLVCRKLGLAAGMRVLDIGCGWGGFARYAAERHGVTVVGVTLSAEQAALASERCRGLPVEIRRLDYRDLGADDHFDRVVSIGMFEHVGAGHHRRFFQIVRRCLVDDGLALLHTIGGAGGGADPWLDANIFPGAVLPTMTEITSASADLFAVEDWHNFGADYDPTLLAWFNNFNRRWPALRGYYGDRFYRLWTCYLLTCAGAFRARRNQLWQLVLSPGGVPGGWHAIR